MEKIENENGETMWLYDDYLDNKMKQNICNFIFAEYNEIPNMDINNEYWDMKFIKFLLEIRDEDFFENLKDKLHIEVPEELERNFESEIIYWLKYWFRDRTVREHYFGF